MEKQLTMPPIIMDLRIWFLVHIPIAAIPDISLPETLLFQDYPGGHPSWFHS
jgi:hypothetical protein